VRERERQREYSLILLVSAADIIVENEAQGMKSVILEKAGKGLGLLGPGDFFGELAALLPPSLAPYRRRYRTAFATATTHLGMLTHDDLMDLCKQRSDIAEVPAPYNIYATFVCRIFM
jgi:CRP-like cAMP-binding protein